MSGTTRRASDDEFPLLPPLSQPPGAAEAPVVRPTGRTQQNLPAAPRGIPDEGARSTLAEQVVLNNKFQLTRRLATRDEEIIYQALHTGTGRAVQIHMLPSGLPPESQEAQRMLRAARAAGRVPHTNVLSVVDSGTDDEGRPFIVYEHFAGASCEELVARDGPFGARLTAEVICQVLEALHAMHPRGVVHRTIRPENVLVDRDGSAVRVKLTGFRYAVVTGKNAIVPEMPKGYSRFLAPEARRGSTTGTGLDIYAVGILMRFLLTGETDPNVDVDAKAARAIARATADDPDERINAEAFLTAVGMMIPDEDGPDSIVPPDPLEADIRYLCQRRERDMSGLAVAPAGAGRIELFPTLLMIEAIYAAVGAPGWQRLVNELPDAEKILPAAGRGDYYREHGVPMQLVSRLLAAGDAIAGKGDLSWLPEVGAAMVRRGLGKFCPGLPRFVTPDALVHCMPVIWSSMSRSGEVHILEQSAIGARISIRAQVEPSLEVCAVVAGLIRAQLRQMIPSADVNAISSQVLGDAADVFVLTWG